MEALRRGCGRAVESARWEARQHVRDQTGVAQLNGGRTRQQFRLGSAAALRLARFARRALRHFRARTRLLTAALPFACADNIALGTACGKMFRCGVLSVTDAGDSDILRSTMPEA